MENSTKELIFKKAKSLYNLKQKVYRAISSSGYTDIKPTGNSYGSVSTKGYEGVVKRGI